MTLKEAATGVAVTVLIVAIVLFVAFLDRVIHLGWGNAFPVW